METQTTWQVLQLHGQDFPTLLVKYHFSPTGYQVNLTDLSRVWEERLTRADIEQSAISSASSIDPSQDQEQYNIFLETIQAALSQQENTTLEIDPHYSTDNELFCKISATLPKPLPPFHWTLHLRLQDSVQIASSLVSPLLQQTRRLQNQLEELVHKLREKDRVIAKICDRLETSGNDLTTVFPGVSHVKTSRKKGQREQLAKHVKGLGDFDEDAWHASSDVKVETEMTGEDMNAVLGSLSASTSKNNDNLGIGHWWTELSSYSNATTETSASRSHEATVADVEKTISQDTGFQRQATPPHLRRKSPSPKDSQNARDSAHQKGTTMDEDKEVASTHEDSSTEDEDDLNAPPKVRKSSSTNQNTSDQLSRALLRREPSGVPRTTSEKGEEQQQDREISVGKPTRRLGAIGGKSSQTPSSSATDAEAINTPAPPTSKSRLGVFGGKSNASAHEAIESTEPHPPQASKIGVLGGQRSRVAKSDADAEKTRESTSPAPERVRETSEERANKKRDELKKELEKKATAPAKKKRRF